MQRNSHESIMLLGVLLLSFPAFINVKHLVVGWARSVSTSMCATLLCLLVLKLFICLFVQHESRWRHVSLWRDVQRLLGGMCMV